MNLEKLAREIAMCKSPNVDKWLVPIADLESMISTMQRQESELAKSHDENEMLKAEREAMTLQLATRQPLADSFVAPFDLTSVINWLENGCDPKEAAKELRIYRDRMSAPAAQPVQQPAAVETIGKHKSFELAAKALHQDWTPEKVHHLIDVVDAYVSANTAIVPAAGVQGKRHSIKELMAIYDQQKGDWCGIARAVEDRYTGEAVAQQTDSGRNALAAAHSEIERLKFELHEATNSLVARMSGVQPDSGRDAALSKEGVK